MDNSKISSSHLAFWQLHSRRGQQQSLSPLTVFFFFFLKSLSLSLSCLSLRFSFLFFSFGFPFGLRRLESSVGLLGLHFWTKIFFFFFLHVGWPVGLERPKSSFFLKINLLKFIYLFIFYRWAGRLGYNFRGGSSYL